MQTTPETIPTFSHNSKEGKWCGTWAMVNDTTKEHFPFWCGSGRCLHPECQKRWFQRKMSVIYGVALENNMDYFFTLTLDPKIVSLEDAWENIQKYWRKFRKAMQYYMKKNGLGKFEFVAVLEEQNGKRKKRKKEATHYPHIHGLYKGKIDQEELRYMWNKCCGGSGYWYRKPSDIGPSRAYWCERGPWNVDVTYIEDREKVITYISKYCSKDEMIEGLKWTKKRTRTLFRTTGLKTVSEKEKACQEASEDVSSWRLVKKEIYNGKEKQRRKNLEGAFCTISKEGARQCSPDMETKETARIRSAEAERASEKERLPECGDKEVEGLILYIMEVFGGKICVQGVEQPQEKSHWSG